VGTDDCFYLYHPLCEINYPNFLFFLFVCLFVSLLVSISFLLFYLILLSFLCLLSFFPHPFSYSISSSSTSFLTLLHPLLCMDHRHGLLLTPTQLILHSYISIKIHDSFLLPLSLHPPSLPLSYPPILSSPYPRAQYPSEPVQFTDNPLILHWGEGMQMLLDAGHEVST
jgi:hypothetical protein